MYSTCDGDLDARAWLEKDAKAWLTLMDHDTWDLERWLENPTKPGTGKEMYRSRV